MYIVKLIKTDAFVWVIVHLDACFFSFFFKFTLHAEINVQTDRCEWDFFFFFQILQSLPRCDNFLFIKATWKEKKIAVYTRAKKKKKSLFDFQSLLKFFCW